MSLCLHSWKGMHSGFNWLTVNCFVNKWQQTPCSVSTWAYHRELSVVAIQVHGHQQLFLFPDMDDCDLRASVLDMSVALTLC